MEVKAVAKYARISPTKVRRAARVVKGKRVEDALSLLGFMPQRSARILGKVIRSAVANADQKPDIEVDSLSVTNIVVDQGPTMKRFRPRAMGRTPEARFCRRFPGRSSTVRCIVISMSVSSVEFSTPCPILDRCLRPVSRAPNRHSGAICPSEVSIPLT